MGRSANVGGGPGEKRRPLRKFRRVDVKCRLSLPLNWRGQVVLVEEVDPDAIVIRLLAVEEGQQFIPEEARVVDTEGRVMLPSAYADETVQVEKYDGAVVVRRVKVTPVSKVQIKV